jgi:hypothetical protein
MPTRTRGRGVALIDIAPMGDDVYRVTLSEGKTQSHHEVSVSAADVERYASGSSAEALVRASFVFLLERESKESILHSFHLPVVERYFPEYPDQIGSYLD